MALNVTDLKFYQSSNGNLGGAPDFNTEVNIAEDGFWDNISAAESAAGDVEYRCLYIRNTSTTNALISPTVTLTQNAVDPDTSIHIAVMNVVNATTVSIANESTAPTGSPAWKTLNEAIAFNTNLNFAANGQGDYVAVWIRRTVLNTNNQAANDNYTISLKGQTSA